ncbi:SHOCT domain-containing protein [Anaeroselena agilis]|uniref:SHOCT domain-containing protein n=1 Tax=Anaeroselena agilis TaxID=3063788 RepID=A0ABU3NUN6_9FIRM|nr:SHOCT domain-containing protein [Selenomonadales bacterium 4137-cl]
MMLMMVLFWGLVIWGGFILVRKLLQTSQDSKQEAAALDILRQRYAKGEISREEFEQMKKELLQ